MINVDIGFEISGDGIHTEHRLGTYRNPIAENAFSQMSMVTHTPTTMVSADR